MTTRFSHVGICTSDLERSVRFYQEALGFEHLTAIEGLGAPFDSLLELPGSRLDVVQLTCGAMKIELLGFPELEVSGDGERCPMNRLGFTHMTLVVDDLDATVGRICELGGAVHPETEVDSPHGRILFCTDPDGVRIELMQAP